MKKPLLTIFILVLMVALPLPSFANSLTTTVNPPFPEEGQSITVTVSSFVTNLRDSLIVWKSGNTTLGEGVGKTTLTIQDAKNQVIVVDVVNRNTGERFSQSIPIYTNTVDIFWESTSSYTPPFYKGKAHAPLESTINVIAMPYTSELSYSYDWSKDSARQVGQSGLGKNRFSFVGSAFDTQHEVSVMASLSNGQKSSDSIIVTYQSPEVVFYEDKGLEGISWNKAVQNGFFVGDGSTTLVAIPYFLSVPHLDSDLYTMKWRVSGGTETIQDPKHKIRLSGTSGVSGKAIVSVVVEHTKKLFEEGEVGVELVF